VERRRTRWRGMLWKATVSRYLLGFRDQVLTGNRQSRRMQDLANVAGRFRSIAMRVEKREARRDIQQQQAAQQGERWPCEPSAGIGFQTHTDTIF
jgi:hypothetical protein